MPRPGAPVFKARYYTGRKRTCDEGHLGHIGKFTRLCGECLRAHWLIGGWDASLPSALDTPRTHCKLVSREDSEKMGTTLTPENSELRTSYNGLSVLVCGSREWTDRLAIWEQLSSRDVELVIHGAARGADSIAGEVAHELGIPVREFLADWDRHGKSAGYRRNAQMVKQGPDLVLAFGEGSGTDHTVKLAEKAGIEVVRIDEHM